MRVGHRQLSIPESPLNLIVEGLFFVGSGDRFLDLLSLVLLSEMAIKINTLVFTQSKALVDCHPFRKASGLEA